MSCLTKFKDDILRQNNIPQLFQEGIRYSILGLFSLFFCFFSLSASFSLKQTLFIILVKLIFEDCKADKFEFITKVKDIAAETKKRVDARLVFEDKITQIFNDNRPVEEEKQAWSDYIKFEIDQGMQKRAKLLYERALISLDKDTHFWISYI